MLPGEANSFNFFNALVENMNTDNIAVLVQGEHLCVKSRGIGDQNSGMTTSKLGGHFFHKSTVRSEFMSLALQS